MMANRFQPDHESADLDQVVEVAAHELSQVRDAARRAAEAIALVVEPDPDDDGASTAGDRSRSQRLAGALVNRAELIESSCDRMLRRLDEVHPRIAVTRTEASDEAPDGEPAEPPSDGVRLLVLQMRAAGEDPATIEDSLRRLAVPDAGNAVDDVLG